jgi:uncharacterized protein (DUF1499 family)
MSSALPTRERALHAAIRWPAYLAWAFLALIMIGVLTVRAGNWQQGLLLYAIACLCSSLLLLWLLLAAALPAWRHRAGAIALRALPALPGAVLTTLAIAASGVPPIHDITTDTANPPEFTRAQSLRGPQSNPLRVDPEVIEQQRAAYPELRTLVSEKPIEATFELATRIARELGWEITLHDLNSGMIEAVDRTPLMGFADDVVIRVRSEERGSVVDLRSVSRVGMSDLGANAARIQRFAERFRAAP